MNKSIRTPFDERAKQAPNLEFLTNRMFSNYDSERDLNNHNNSGTVILKTATDFNSVINQSSFGINSFLQEPCFSVPLPEDNISMYIKEKNIKKILNSIISLNDKEKGILNKLEEQIDTVGLDIKKQSFKAILSNHSSPYKPLKKSPTVSLSLLNNTSKLYSRANLLSKPLDFHYFTSSNRMLTSNEQIKGSIDKKNKLMTITELHLNSFKEMNWRCLKQNNYNIYDSCSDDEDEAEKNFIIIKQSSFLLIWNIIMLIMILYYVIILPYCLAFLPYVPLIIKVVELLTEIAYVIDIFIQFLIPLPSEISEEYIYDKQYIAWQYILGWFSIDLIIAVPYCTIINYVVYPHEDKIYLSNPIILLKLIKIFKVLKLLMYPYDKYEHQSLDIDNFLPSKNKRLIIFFFMFMIFTHTLTCLWSFIGTLSHPNWIIRQNLIDKSNIEKYFSSFYFTLATIYSIGYGDIYPITTYERIYDITLQGIGLFIYSYMISSMTEILKHTEKEIKFQLQNDLLENIKIDYKIDISLYAKIKRYLHHSYKLNNEERLLFLESLPNSIKRQLIILIYSNLLKFKIFRNTNLDFKTRVILSLKPVCFPRGEIIIKTGSFIEDVVFVKRGVVGIECQYKNNIIKIKKLRLGDHYGEVNMLLDNESEFDLVVKSKHAELLLLSNEKLISIAQEFPIIFSKIKERSLVSHSEFIQLKKQKSREINLLAIEQSRLIIKKAITVDYDTDDNESNQKKAMFIRNNLFNDVIIEELNEEEDEVKHQSSKSKGLEVFCTNKESNSFNSISEQCESSLSSKQKIENQKSIPKDSKESNEVTKCKDLVMLNKQAHLSKSSQSLLTINTNQYLLNPKTNINLKELNPKRKVSSASIHKVQKFEGMQRKSIKMMKKVNDGSMVINNPSQFYGEIFEKWSMENQYKRMSQLWDVISSRQFYLHQKNRFQIASAMKRRVISSRDLSKLSIDVDK